MGGEGWRSWGEVSGWGEEKVVSEEKSSLGEKERPAVDVVELVSIGFARIHFDSISQRCKTKIVEHSPFTNHVNSFCIQQMLTRTTQILKTNQNATSDNAWYY